MAPEWLSRLLRGRKPVGLAEGGNLPPSENPKAGDYELTDRDRLAAAEYIRKSGGRDYGPKDVTKLFTGFRGAENLNQFQTDIKASLARWQPLLGAVPTDEEAWSTVRLEYRKGLYWILIEPPAYSAEARQALDALCKQTPSTPDVQQPYELWNIEDDHWMTITAKTPEQLVETYNTLMEKILAHANSKVPLDQLTLALPDRGRGHSS